VRFDGGEDTDVASFNADGSVRGGLTFLLGNATIGEQAATLKAASGFPGNLKISGGIEIESSGQATSSDAAKLTNVNLGGSLTLRLGDGASTVDMDNIVAALALTIETRGGDDDVQIERDATFGKSSFKGLATIQLGYGNDSLLVGKGSKHNSVLFYRDILADGGDGTDTRNDLDLDNDLEGIAVVTQTAFEIIPVPAP
jgi:hypothetical protein